MSTTNLIMCRRTLLVLFGVSFILIITDLLGRPARSAPLIPGLTQKTRDIHEDPFQAPRLVGCDSEDVIPGKYTVILKDGYPLEQHMEATGTDLSSSIGWASSASPRWGTMYRATFDNATLVAVLKDVGVKLVKCNRKLMCGPLETAIPVQEVRRTRAGLH